MPLHEMMNHPLHFRAFDVQAARRYLFQRRDPEAVRLGLLVSHSRCGCPIWLHFDAGVCSQCRHRRGLRCKTRPSWMGAVPASSRSGRCVDFLHDFRRQAIGSIPVPSHHESRGCPQKTFHAGRAIYNEEEGSCLKSNRELPSAICLLLQLQVAKPAILLRGLQARD